MDLPEVLSVVRKHVWLIVIAAFVGVAGGVGLSMLMTPKYQAQTQLYVTVPITDPTATGPGDLVQGTTYARQAVMSYMDVVVSPLVLDPVIERLGLDTTAADLAENITASSPEGTVLLNITVLDESPEGAAMIANTVGEEFTSVVVEELETTGVEGVSRVGIQTIKPALPDDSPVSPKPLINVAIGLLAGLVVGIGLAFLRNLLDNRIHSKDDIKAITDTPMLGSIPRNPHAGTKPLIVHDEPRSQQAESFRRIRTNLQFLDYNNDSRRFVVTSAGQDEGKSTTISNLAIILAEGGSRVALVDCDLRKPTIAQVMGIEGAVGLTDVLIGRANLADVLQPWGAEGRLSVLPAGRIPPNPGELLGSDGMSQILEELSADFDYVLIDTPPLLAISDAAVLAQYASGTLLVASTGSTTRNALASAIEALEAVNSGPAGIILTKVPTGRGSDRYGYGSYRESPAMK